jgi:flagellar M-ring protein FliF
MGFLYTDLDPSAAATITEKLKAQNVEYTLSADGTSVMAPQDKLAELRMSLAGEKLGGKIGYEVLDEEQPFGVSASRAKMNETRASKASSPSRSRPSRTSAPRASTS